MDDLKFIHQLSSVMTECIGNQTRIWQYVVVLPGAKIVDDCNICSHCFIENDVAIGARLMIKMLYQYMSGCSSRTMYSSLRTLPSPTLGFRKTNGMQAYCH